MKLTGTISRMIPALLLIGLFDMTCKSGPEGMPGTDSDASAGLVIAVDLHETVPAVAPDKMYFVRLDDSGNNRSGAQILATNWNQGNRGYLFNVQPGTYIAVAADFEGGKKRAFFTEEIMNATKVTVAPGKLYNMGYYDISLIQFQNRYNSIESHYREKIEKPGDPAAEQDHTFMSYLSSSKSASEAQGNPSAEIQQDLKETDWADLLD